jgi:hypothetical protein
MASAGWDEVLGGGAAGGGEGPPPDEPDADEEEAPRKKRVPTSTKIVLVAFGWVLLVLFLVGQFSKHGGPAQPVAQLDTVAKDGASAEPEPVDTEEEAAFDANGDGLLSADEQAAAESAGVAVGGSNGGSGGSSSEAATYEGTPTAGGSAGGSSGSSGTTTPGAAPGGGSTGGVTTTTASGGGGGGGGQTTTTTAKGSTTTTTSKGGGGTTTTSTTAAPTTTTTASSVPSTASSSFKGLVTGFVPNDVTMRLKDGAAHLTVSNDSNSDRDFNFDGDVRKIKKGESATITFNSAGDSTVTVTVGQVTQTLTVHVQA